LSGRSASTVASGEAAAFGIEAVESALQAGDMPPSSAGRTQPTCSGAASCQHVSGGIEAVDCDAS
jgi:hypothetical protein